MGTPRAGPACVPLRLCRATPPSSVRCCYCCCCCNAVRRYRFRYRYRYRHGRPRGWQGRQGQIGLLSIMPPKSWLGRLLIPLPGTLALGPVAHLPARQIKIAALAIPIGTYAEISVTRRLAGVAVAKAPVPPIVIATKAARPISILPFCACDPVRAISLLSLRPTRGRVYRRLRQWLGLPRRHGPFLPPRGLRGRRGRCRGRLFFRRHPLRNSKRLSFWSSRCGSTSSSRGRMLQARFFLFQRLCSQSLWNSRCLCSQSHLLRIWGCGGSCCRGTERSGHQGHSRALQRQAGLHGMLGPLGPLRVVGVPGGSLRGPLPAVSHVLHDVERHVAEEGHDRLPGLALVVAPMSIVPCGLTELAPTRPSPP